MRKDVLLKSLLIGTALVSISFTANAQDAQPQPSLTDRAEVIGDPDTCPAYGLIDLETGNFPAPGVTDERLQRQMDEVIKNWGKEDQIKWDQSRNRFSMKNVPNSAKEVNVEGIEWSDEKNKFVSKKSNTTDLESDVEGLAEVLFEKKHGRGADYGKYARDQAEMNSMREKAQNLQNEAVDAYVNQMLEGNQTRLEKELPQISKEVAPKLKFGKHKVTVPGFFGSSEKEVDGLYVVEDAKTLEESLGDDFGKIMLAKEFLAKNPTSAEIAAFDKELSQVETVNKEDGTYTYTVDGAEITLESGAKNLKEHFTKAAQKRAQEYVQGVEARAAEKEAASDSADSAAANVDGAAGASSEGESDSAAEPTVNADASSAEPTNSASASADASSEGDAAAANEAAPTVSVPQIEATVDSVNAALAQLGGVDAAIYENISKPKGEEVTIENTPLAELAEAIKNQTLGSKESAKELRDAEYQKLQASLDSGEIGRDEFSQQAKALNDSYKETIQNINGTDYASAVTGSIQGLVQGSLASFNGTQVERIKQVHEALIEALKDSQGLTDDRLAREQTEKEADEAAKLAAEQLFGTSVQGENVGTDVTDSIISALKAGRDIASKNKDKVDHYVQALEFEINVIKTNHSEYLEAKNRVKEFYAKRGVDQSVQDAIDSTLASAYNKDIGDSFKSMLDQAQGYITLDPFSGE